MGTSDPNLPLYLDGELIERKTTNGGFGVYLTDIPVGTSTHTLSQGLQSQTFSITRIAPDQSSVSYISKIVQSSMYPYYHDAVTVGEPIHFSCTAPAGANVSVTFQGKKVSLTQKAAAQSGVPAVYSGTMTMPDLGEDNATTNRTGNLHPFLSRRHDQLYIFRRIVRSWKKHDTGSQSQ